jgi:hypothetical protein
MDDSEHKLLRYNHISGVPRLVMYFDTETKEKQVGKYGVHRMILGWSNFVRYKPNMEIESSVWNEWEHGRDFWAYVHRMIPQKMSLFLFAHNAFFDLQASGFFRWFAQWKWTLTFLYERGMSYILIASHKHRSIKIISSTNYYECSLAQMGNMVGIPKQEVNFSNATKEQLSKYCKNDVRILRAGMEKWMQFCLNHDLGQFSLTKASQAMHAYRHRFMQHKITLHKDKKVAALERRSYYGGRCECFELGEIQNGPFVTYDVNSMYPYVMKTQGMPVRLTDTVENCSLADMKRLISAFCVVADCTVETDKPIYPYKYKGKLIFPVGTFDVTLTTPSIMEALIRGHLKEIRFTAFYDRAFIFKKYVDYFYRLKAQYSTENKPIERYAVKVLLNALYGKWAQKRPIVSEEMETETGDYYREIILDAVTGEKEMVYKLLNKRVVTYGEEDAKNCFTAISAHITDAARIYLWKLIEPLWPGHVIYIDTDSLKVRQSSIGLIKAPMSDRKLGALKIESTCDVLQILAPKSYQSDGKRIFKGIPKSAVQLDKFAYRYTSFLKQHSHLRKNLDYGVLSVDMVKQLSTEYNKGIVNPDGTVRPFQLPI